jgi:hypothetical protein
VTRVILAAFDASPGPFIAVMALGFLIGVAGHVYRSQTAVIIGIGLVFLATLGLPLILHFGGD